MSLNADLREKYEAVLHDLEAECQQIKQQLATLHARLKELQGSAITLTKRINSDSTSPIIPVHSPNTRYANISVRWAILDLLKNSQRPMSTAEIAEALTHAGVQTRATNFANNVSAVLSTTMREHKEVQQFPDGKWELTDNGDNAIEHIRTTPKFRRALLM